jgi:hypothetical protein
MLNDVLSVIDRLISLRKYRNERFRAKCRELCDPIFHDLLLVHTDYVKMFEDIQVRIRRSSDQKHFSKAVEILREQRLEFEAVREKLKAIAGTLSSKADNQPEEVNTFINVVSFYFQWGPLFINVTPSYALMDRLEIVIKDAGPEFSSEEMDSMRKIVEDALSGIRQSWSRVCEAYAALTVSAAERA